MQITLLHYTPLNICSHAIRTCYQSFSKGDNGGDIDIALIDKVGNQLKHSSTLEHITYNFYIDGISRACLQEVARHRIASYSVKSSRFTLGELKKENSFNLEDKERANKYIVLTGNEDVDNNSIKALENLRILLVNGIKNDLAKYVMPECYKTSLTWSINARSLQNFIHLRSSPKALKEIQDLAKSILAAIPKEHIFLFIEN